MEIIRTIREMQNLSKKLSSKGAVIGCVPTMGYLHEGHLNLIRKAKEISDYVVMTLFVNPKQFGPNEDFEKYPRDLDRDYKLAENAGCDLIFAPDILEMYPIGFSTSVEIHNITRKFEGERRPGHFDGVALVVAKLFNAVKPDVAVFGQKDYQQTLVIKQLVRDLNFDIKIVIAPTVREADGLAMSSRNTYLTPELRAKANVLFNALEDGIKAIEGGCRERKVINAIMHKRLRSIPEIKIDYACAALAENLDEPDVFLAGDLVVLLIACYLGTTRLIDNALVTVPKTNLAAKKQL